jgi:hypothetical protein
LLTIDPLASTSFQKLLENTSVLQVFGFVEDRLYLQNYQENMVNITLPIE